MYHMLPDLSQLRGKILLHVQRVSGCKTILANKKLGSSIIKKRKSLHCTAEELPSVHYYLLHLKARSQVRKGMILSARDYRQIA